MEPLAPDPVLPQRLRPLAIVCAALAASVVVAGSLSWYLVEVAGVTLPVPALPGLPLSLTAAGLVLLLLASRLRAGLLRRLALLPPAEPGLAPLLRAYTRATVVCFSLLEAAALLGLLLALMTGTARYGVIFAAAALFAMLVRWPRAAEVERLVRRSTGLRS